MHHDFIVPTIYIFNLKSPQVMSCIPCYNSPIIISNSQLKTKKGLISYNITNEIIALQAHMHANYYVIAKLFEEVNDLMKAKEEGKLRKKVLIYLGIPSPFFLL